MGNGLGGPAHSTTLTHVHATLRPLPRHPHILTPPLSRGYGTLVNLTHPNSGVRMDRTSQRPSTLKLLLLHSTVPAIKAALERR